MRTGGQILIEQLRQAGTQRIFTVPGESFIAALDALHDTAGIDVIVCRHEGAASMMAEATARLAGPASPAAGVVFVSRGPGLANAMSGLHVAMQGATPILALVGLPPRRFEGRGGFQEVALAPLVGTFAKHADTVRDATRIPEAIQRALVTAHSGRRGPVVIGLPEDVLFETRDVTEPPAFSVPEPSPAYEDLIRLADAIDAAQWPIVIAGGRWSPNASRQLQAFAERIDLPVIAAFRSQDVIDNRSPCFCGHAGIAPPTKLASAISSADLVIAIGTHLDEITTGGYETIAVPAPRQKLVHIHPDASTISRNHHAAISIISTTDRFARHLDDLLPSMRPGMPHPWNQLRSDMRTAYTAHKTSQKRPHASSALYMEDVIAHLDQTLPETAIITNGAGNYAAHLHRFFTYKAPLTQLAPLSGSMGYGLPAAIAAKLAHPDREVVALAGDGCFQMVSQDFATAVQYGTPITIVIANNASLGTVRAAQERHYPGRVIATSLINPDFVAIAQAHRADASRVTNLAQFKQALATARKARAPYIIELTLDREAIFGGFREASLKT